MRKDYLTTSTKFSKINLTIVLIVGLIVQSSLFAQTAVTAINTNAVPATSSSYTVGVDTYVWGVGNDLFLTSVELGGNTFNYDSSISKTINLIRIDNPISTDFRSRLMAERTPPNARIVFPSLPASDANGSRTEDALLQPIVNRGALDLFQNVDSGSQNANNIERVDILYSPFSSPASVPLLDEVGYMVGEKNGNNGVKIAAITSLDVSGNPASYGPLVLVDSPNYGEPNPALQWSFFENNPMAPHDEPRVYSSSIETYGISLVTFADLGIGINETIYGISVFGSDVTGVFPEDLLNPLTFPSNTDEGADVHGGLGGLVKTVNFIIAPLAQDDLFITLEDVAISGDLFADNGSGTDQIGVGPINVTAFDNPSANGGTVNVNANGTFTYTPPLNFSGNDTFTYTITDANGSTSIGNVTINVLPDPDGDGISDDIDLDDDNDGIIDTVDGLVDTDGDSILNRVDLDDDNDGIYDIVESGLPDSNGDGMIDGFVDLNANGLHDPLENPELYPQDNAASTFTEVDAIGGWSDSTVAITSDATTSFNGTYSIRIEATQDGTFDKGEFPFSAVIGQTYDVSMMVKRGVQGTTQRIFNWGGVVTSPDVNVLTQDWTIYNFKVTASATTITLRVYAAASGGSIGDVVSIDAVSITDELIQTFTNTDTTGGPDYLDIDSDDDGIPDNVEGQTTAGYQTPSGNDIDNNGVDDNYDSNGTPIVPENTDTLDNPDYQDTDSDNDGILDAIENGSSINNTFGIDTDNDGLDDAWDDVDGTGNTGAPSNVNDNLDVPDLATNLGDEDLDGEVDYRDIFDTDNDGVANSVDLDDDNDGILDLDEYTGGLNPDDDADSDGVPAYIDDNDSDPLTGDVDGLVQPGYDLDSDGVANHLDIDADGDGVFDVNEAGHAELDGDNDGRIDGADTGSGLNGLFDAIETIPESGVLNYVLLNTDGDALINALDIDDDGDGVDTVNENADPNNDGDPADAQNTDGDANPDYLDIDDDGDGVDTANENADPNNDGDPADAQDTDGDANPDYLDIDDDGDGVNTIFENDNTDGDGDPTTGISLDTDGDTTLDYLDIDDDGDGVNTIFENDNTDGDGDPTSGTSLDTDSDTTLDYLDVDDDGDGINTEFEGANPDGDNDPTTGATQDSDSDTIFDYLDADDDGDGVNTEFEADNTDGDGDPSTGVQQDTDSDATLDYLDTDDDGDGVNTIFENDNTDGDGDPTTGTSLDTDSDTTLDYLDVDDDGDGINTEFEGANPDGDNDPTTGATQDSDSDTIFDYLDADDDGDGVNTEFEADNTDGDGDPSTGVQQDTDSDATLDYLDIDDDGDGVNTIFENDNTDGDGDPTTGTSLDTDSDTTLDYLDVDDDGDGVNTEFEVDNADLDGDPTTGIVIDTDSDTILDYLDADDDGDGIDTINENPDPDGDFDPADAQDSDGDTIPDYLDADDDNDGIDTADEDADGDGDPSNDDTDGDGVPNYLDLDSDNDGIQDELETGSDADGDGVLNYIDLDSDNDGIYDVVEAGLSSFDSNNDGIIDTLISVGTNGLFDGLETFPDSGVLDPTYTPIDSSTVGGVATPDGIFDFLELDSDTDGCNDVTEAGYTDLDSDGILGTSPAAVNPTNGLVISGVDGYTTPNDVDTNSVFDFQEFNVTTAISVQPVTPPPTLVGGTVNIDVTATGNTFQWQVSTAGIGGPYSDLPTGPDPNYSGVDSPNLVISNVPLSFDGNFYRVFVSTNNYACDTPVISDAVQVTIQSDNDGDGIADVNDLDDDNDGIPDTDEGGDVLDSDGDGIPNRFDLDSDNDGIYDLVESGQLDNGAADSDNNGIVDGAVGANGLLDSIETDDTAGATVTIATVDSDGDSIPDSNEINADGDGCNDVIEAGFTDGDNNGYLGTGTPGSGLITDPNGVVTGQGGYTTPDDNDSNGIYDFQEVGAQVILTDQPLDETITINMDANFDVSGTSPVYQWQESTDNGITWNNVSNGGTAPAYSGATTDALTLTLVPITYNGYQYRVILSSPAYACGGNITSNAATLTVYSDFDGDGVGDPVDLDDDNDGLSDLVESGGVDPTSDADGDGVPVYLDDNDNNISVGDTDGVEAAFDFDGDGLANHLELDADNDGIYDTNEAGFGDLDANNDGVVDGVPADFGANGLFNTLEDNDSATAVNNFTALNTDSDLTPNFIDIDDDGDNVWTIYENADANGDGDPSDSLDTDLDTIPNYLDNDDDGDTVNTIFEVSNSDADGNPGTNPIDTDGDSILNYLDVDDDGDSINTIYEVDNSDLDGNPNTGIIVNTDGVDTLDYLDIDDDNDSVYTIYEVDNSDADNNPNTNPLDTDGNLVWNHQDIDDDGDSVNTIYEAPVASGDNGNPVNAQNTDSDASPDYLDVDDDGDSVWTIYEGPDPDGDQNPNTGLTLDTDGDGEYDYLDIDDDGDTINTIDESPDFNTDGNPDDAQDTDGDVTFDYLDIDDDNDGILTAVEESSPDGDNDSRPNYLDLDSDNDGIPDNVEAQTTADYIAPSGDGNNNGLDDSYESTNGLDPFNFDGTDDPDYLDDDSDNDNVPDFVEGHDFNADGEPDIEATGNDTDGDGLDDAYDSSADYSDPNGLTIVTGPAEDLPNRDQSLFDMFSPTTAITPDAEVDYRDTDDDGDGRLTNSTGADGEDTDSDGNPRNDNCNGPPDNNSPNYLDPVPCNFIPSGFSPNGDNQNEEFIINQLSEYPNFTMEVYDRWGNIVYKYSNDGRPEPIWWDGFSSGSRTLNKGQKVPVGTYYYVIEYNQDGRKPIAGWVYINY